MVVNVHTRTVAAGVGELIGTLAGEDDKVWPGDTWPPMRLDRPLGVGAAGGHGPIGYVVEEYEPGRRVRFRFTAPRGFLGHHEFEAEGAELRHRIVMRTRGLARLTWPLAIRHLHDALVEDAFDRACAAMGVEVERARWSWWVRLLRALAPKDPALSKR
ncbi:hypothetical protein GCM10023148_35530 [Actinokineospora soli]